MLAGFFCFFLIFIPCLVNFDFSWNIKSKLVIGYFIINIIIDNASKDNVSWNIKIKLVIVYFIINIIIDNVYVFIVSDINLIISSAIL